jgi:nucleoid DNA-binding protein
MSFNAVAMTQGEMEDGWVEKYGGTKASAHEKFQAWENTLKAELANKKAVQIEGIGTFRPQELSGKVRKSGFGSSPTPSYAMVKKPELVTDTEFQKKMAAAGKMTDEEAAKVSAHYKTAVAASLKYGGGLSQAGLGTYKTRMVDATPTAKRHLEVKFDDNPSAHVRLKVDPALNKPFKR